MAKEHEPIGGVTPENIVRDLEKFAAWEPADSPRAIAMREAAAVLRALPVKQSDAKRLDDDAFAIAGYRIDIDDESKEKTMRIVFFGDKGNQRVLGYRILNTSDAYDFSTRIMSDYDKLEGIK